MARQESEIISSWTRNAHAWTRAVRQRTIESRRLVTDTAIQDTVVALAPRSVLDLGCGEGWLAHALMARGISVVGVDAIPALIEAARSAGGDFRLASYEEVANGTLVLRADVAVCNFSLLGQDSVECLFASIGTLLNAGGRLVIQTLHPSSVAGEYRDGWRPGSWEGCGNGFAEPAPWYFRTLESWLRLFTNNGLAVLDLREPIDPRSGRPASIIFVGALVR